MVRKLCRSTWSQVGDPSVDVSPECHGPSLSSDERPEIPPVTLPVVAPPSHFTPATMLPGPSPD
eukprot:8878701-Prorocentrum_lima.AAC.1